MVMGLMLATAVAALSWYPGRGAPLVAVERCVSAHTWWSSLGVHVGLAHPDGVCAAGQFALGPSSGTEALITVMIAAPVLVANLLSTAVAIGYGLLVRAWFAAVVALVRSWWWRPVAAPCEITARGTLLVRPRSRTVTGRVAFLPIQRRGPPVVPVA